MASKIIQKLEDKAERLYQIRQVISEKEEQSKKELESLKLERDLVQAELVADMKKTGLHSAKVSSGDSFNLGKRKGVEIVNEALAFKWAYENRAVSVDRRIVSQILKDAKEIPPGFDLTETEFISVRKAKNVPQ